MYTILPQKPQQWLTIGLTFLFLLAACAGPTYPTFQGDQKAVLPLQTSEARDAWGYRSSDIERLRQKVLAKPSHQDYPVALSLEPSLLKDELQPVLSAVFD